MSDTPRTDNNAGCLIDTEEVVPADFARILETELAAMTARTEKSERLWKEFITLMEITEESDSGYAFSVNKISSCRAMDGKRLNEILNEARQIIFAKQ